MRGEQTMPNFENNNENREQRWWDHLQQLLNDNGLELDLSVPEDLARLLILDAHREDYNEYTVTAQFAMDPQNRPLDEETITNEEIVARQQPGVPDAEMLEKLMTAAREGRLFVLSHIEAAQAGLPKPILLDGEGQPRLGEDMEHVTEEDDRMTEVLEEPELPRDPGGWNSVKSFFGSDEARREAAAYERRMNTYRELKERWDVIRTMNQTQVTRARNSYLINQDYFFNMELGSAHKKFNEQLTRLHEQAALRNMPEERQRVEAERIRRAQSISDAVMGNIGPRIEAEQIRSSDPLSPEDRRLLAGMMISFREMKRAESTLAFNGGAGFVPKAEAVLNAEMERLLGSERFRVLCSQLNGGSLKQLYDNAKLGRLATLTGLDKMCGDAWSAAQEAEQEQWEREVRDPLLNPERKGQMIDNPFGGAGLYTFVAPKYASAMAKEMLEKNHLGPVGTDYTDQQALFLMNNIMALSQQMEKDPLEFTFRYPQEKLDALGRTLKADYRPLSPEEQKQREENRAIISRKFSRFACEKGLTLDVATNRPPVPPRPWQALFAAGTDQDTMLYNEELKRKLTAGTTEEKRQAFLDKFREIGEYDLSGLDPTDPQNLIQNFERFEPVMSLGPELGSLVKSAQELGIDMGTPENRPLIEKMGIMVDLAAMARAQIDLMSSTVYTQLRIEELEPSFANYGLTNVPQITDADGDPFDLEEYIEENNLDDNSPAEAVFRQIGMVMHMKRDNPLFDKAIPQEQRFAEFTKGFWQKSSEVQPGKMTKVFRRGEVIDRDENGYDDFAEDSELEGVEEAEQLSAEEIRQINPEQPQPEEPRVRTEKEMYRVKFLRNLQILREAFPDFKMEDSEIDAYLTDERLEMHRRAVEYRDGYSAMQKELEGKGLPSAFLRVSATFMDKSGTPAAEEKNAKLTAWLCDPGEDGNRARKDCLLNMINCASRLDPDKFSFQKPIDEIGNYILDHADDLVQAWNMKYALSHLDSSLGFGLSPEKEAQLQKLAVDAQPLQGVGGVIKDLMASEAFLTLPFDRITPEQGAALLGMVPRMKNLPQDASAYLDLGNYATASLGAAVDVNMERPAFTAEDLQDVKPTPEEAKNSYSRLYELLKSADKWYLWGNSPEYRELLGALKELNKGLQTMGDGMDIRKTDALRRSFKRVGTAAEKYISHVGNAGKDEIQQQRLELAKETRLLTRHAAGSDILFHSFVEQQNEAALKEYYGAAAPAPEGVSEEAVQAQEQTFRIGLKRTEDLRAQIEAADQAEVADFEETFLLEAGPAILEAREKLTAMVGRKELDPEALKKPLAQVLQGSKLRVRSLTEPGLSEVFDEKVEQTLANPVFSELVRDMTSEKLNTFLTGAGEHEFTKQYDAGVQRALKNAQQAAVPQEQLDLQKGDVLTGEAHPGLE